MSLFPPRERAALELLDARQQNPVNAPDLAGPVIYEHFYVALADAVFAPHLSDALLDRLKTNNYVLNHALDRILLDTGVAAGADADVWWQGERDSRLRDAFSSAVGRAAAAPGEEPADWRWDDILAVTARHELASEIPLLGARLNLGPYPWGGGPATLGRARYRYGRRRSDGELAGWRARFSGRQPGHRDRSGPAPAAALTRPVCPDIRRWPAPRRRGRALVLLRPGQ